ncbi:unnamed protein product [Lymnaea stagnalis]|uniref:AAA+ ATPase domain-containing protein n=1 Tax=Lymnaea stagnalis TaxID=6523 RepID=A0AAV2HSD3_LYMST
MAPKKKDKAKLSEWFQCSLCDKLVSAYDADVHSKSCEAEHGYVQRKTLYGKIIKAEGILVKDGSLLTKTLRSSNDVIWLAIPAMQICGLSIGQPCIVNRTLIKQVWPYQTSASSTVAVTARCLDEMGLKEGDVVTVERFKPQGYKALSVQLKLQKSNPLFETQEFSSFISSYLDGKYVTNGMPLNLRYFGLHCQCFVYNVHHELDASHSSEAHKSNNVLETLPNINSPKELPELSEDGDASFCSASQDLSLSMTSLNISTSSLDDSAPAPQTPLKRNYPNLGTPLKDISDSPNRNDSGVTFAVVSSSQTKFTVVSSASQEISDAPRFSLSDTGGLSTQINELRSRVLRAQQAKSNCCCILLHGPAGTGKTLLVKALAADLKANTIQLTGTDIWSKLFGEAEANLRKAFQDAQEKPLSLIIIDDMDVMCPKRSPNSAGQQEHRLVGTLVSLIDGAAHSKHSSLLVIIGITNKKDDIDPALRRAGRFGCEVEVGVPTMVQRKEILQVLLSKIPHNLSFEDIETVAMNAHGYVGADLAALLNEASLHALSRQGPPPSELGTASLQLTLEDLIFAGSLVKPSALREIQLEVTQVKWSDIGGMSEVKMRLREAVELPLSNPEVFKRLGIEPPRGLLMYGPPGCSKTMVARALATESKLNFLAVKGPELFNQYVGQSEKAVREVFRKARSAAPSIIFFDEIDAIAAKRGSSCGSGVDDRVLTQLLTEMDGLEFLKDVFIMAATNRPDKIDNALLRPGRFDSLVYVPLPDDSTREEILLKKFTKMCVGDDVNVKTLVELTQDYSGAEIIQVCHEAALSALREDINSHQVLFRHFETALKKVQPQIDPELIQIYQKFSNTRIK